MKKKANDIFNARFLKKIFLWQWGIIVLLLWMSGCKKQKNKLDCPISPIVILYENDVHCALDGYAKLAGLQKKKKMLTPYVTTVSCGDFVQGDVIASVSEGKNIINIMNLVGYDVVTLGNHEFDYGVKQMFQLMSNLKATTVCANFRDLTTNQFPFPAYKIMSYGKVDIAYIGLTTTMTPNDVIHKTFRDSTGRIIYDFSRDLFYVNLQKQVDEARKEGADYVIVLSHVGGNYQQKHPNSMQLIARTTGIDVVLDGHDHQVIDDTLIKNKKGIPVLLSSTGTKFEYIGVLTLSEDGVFTTQLLPKDDTTLVSDQTIKQFIQEIKENSFAEGERVIGFNAVNLSINDQRGRRMVRNQETNLGNFCCDAFRLILNTDVALLNGGGIRADLLPGNITYNACYSVFPFNNTVCVGSMTGQELLNALEFSVSSLPREDGSFLQVSGIKFEVDTTIPTPVVRGEDDSFSRIETGRRRVSHLQVWDQEAKTYKPIDLNRRYSIAGIDYQLKNAGSSGILKSVVLEKENLGQDVEILVSYIQQILDGKIGECYATTEGRIQIKN